MGTKLPSTQPHYLSRNEGDFGAQPVLEEEGQLRVLGIDELAADRVQALGSSIHEFCQQTTILGSVAGDAALFKEESFPFVPLEPVAASLLQVRPDPRPVGETEAFDEFADGCRVFVWRNSQWHPVSATQLDQIKVNLGEGRKVFDVSDGAYSWTVDTRTKKGWLQTSPAGAQRPMRCTPTLFHIDDLRSELLAKLQGEWHDIIGTASSMTAGDLLRYWRKTSSAEDDDQLLIIVDDLFKRIDFKCVGRVILDEWIHFRLLELQAPSAHAIREVNARLTSWMEGYSQIVPRFVELFLQACGDSSSMRLTISQMKDAVRTWFSHASIDMFNAEYIQNMKDLLNSDSDFEEGEMITYYEFLIYMTGQTWTPVDLYFYDLTKGSAWMWTPLVFGRPMPCLWHCGVVVFGKEYRYGGNIFESTPGQTAFGEPQKIMTIGMTCRTRQDLLNFINRNLANIFAVDGYQVLTNNSNHFCDALVMYLTNTHIPTEVLQQPEIIMASQSVQLLGNWMPWLKGVQLTQTQAARTADAEWAAVDERTVVNYEYEDGWTIIARVIKKHECSCDLSFFSRQDCRFHTRRGVSRRAVQPFFGVGDPLYTPCLPQRKF